jgi:hypothetical protein
MQLTVGAMVLPRRSYVVPRSSPRTFMHAAAEVQCSAVAGTHVGVIRDLSEGGVFFYSNFKPPVGTRVRVVFAPPNLPRNQRVLCEGTVVRVEQVRSDAAPGIAVCVNKNAAARSA